jgi:FkbM family methyltransferase
MKSGATETAYVYLSEHYQFPDNVFVSHLPEEIKKSNHSYKILWAHHAYDQPVFVNFDHNTVNHIVSPSQWNKEQLIRYHNIPEHKISVIPNGVADIFSYSDKKTKTMIYTSIPYKGLEVLARIIPKIHQVHPDAKFKIFSSMSLYGPSNDQFINIYDHLKTLPYVEYSAAVDQVELVPHYQEAAFFIHPNIWEETFCVSMVEAMKSGAYPIITNIGALAEVAGENNASVVPIDGTPTSKGYQVTEDFMNSFADACCLALDYYDKDQEYYHKVSKIISDGVSEKYNWKRVAEQWQSLIHMICGNTLIFRENTLDKWIYDEVYTHNVYEIGELEENDVVVDIGSHCGYFGKLCLDRGSKKVFLYEPDTENYNLLLKNLSNCDGWNAENVAVWKEQSDDLPFYTYSEYKNTGLNSVFRSPYIEPSEIKKVKSVSLDSILSSFDSVKVLKIDAEGSEYDILMNSNLIGRVDTIVGEYHNDLTDKKFDDLSKFLQSNNFGVDKIVPTNDTSGTFFAKNNRSKVNPPVYYCMVSTHNSEEYTDLAINSFFRNTQFREQDRFFLIDNDGKYQLTQNRDKITIISNHQPKSFAENMNFVMKLAFIDKSDFLGLSNDLFFTENWNKNFGTRKSISVPLCNQKLTGEFGDLKIKSAMNIDDFGEKENELNEFLKTIDPQKVNINKEILGFHCFHIPYEILSKVGFFDEKFVNGAEDIDYRLRAYDLGFDMDVNCSSYLLHFYGKSSWRSGENGKKTAERYNNYKNYFEKKWGKELAEKYLVKL